MLNNIIDYDSIINTIDVSWKKLFESNKTELELIFKKISEDEPNILPERNNIFRVFTKPLQDIKVVLLGQDPYPKKGNAVGLSFSATKDTNIPGSLSNMFKEINRSYSNKYNFNHADLSRWFNQEGIFLFNVALTVKEGVIKSHLSYWTNFSDNVIKFIDSNNKKVAFLLLGNDAIKKINIIVNNKENVITGPHPSPLNTSKKILGSDVFIKLDNVLLKMGLNPINYSL